jgi:AraC-like DNA-binding protein
MARVSNGFKGERVVIIPSKIVEEIKNHEIGHDLYVSKIGFYPKASYHYCEHNEEGDSDFVLIYCVDGKGWVKIENNKLILEQDQLIVIPRNKKYAYGSDYDTPWTIYWIHFNGERAGYLSRNIERPVSILRDANSRINERLSLFEEIYAALNHSLGINNLAYASMVFSHFLGTIKYIAEYRQCNQMDNKGMDVINLAINFMRENINRKITLSDIASYVGLSESYFSALFIKETQNSPLRYYANLRFERACHYLDFTDMKVNQICPLVGFEDSLYFSRAFTKIKGMSPSEYRRIHKRIRSQGKIQMN